MQELEKKIQHIKVGAKTLMIILEYVLDIVEHVEGIKGNKKKTLAILLITKVVENATLDEDDKNLSEDKLKERYKKMIYKFFQKN